MKQGFTLIELLIAVSISSMLSLSLYKLIQQTRFVVSDITTVIATDVPLSALYGQLEKDITGILYPFSVQKELEQQAQQPEKPAGYAVEQKSPEKPEEKKQEEKKLQDIFYINQTDNGLFWSFLTTGGLQAITSKGELQARPLIKRVAYRLEKDPSDLGTFSLYYSSSVDKLDLDTLKNRPLKQYYELIGSLRQLKIQTTVFDVPEAPEAQTNQADSKPEAQPKTPQKLENWNEKEIKEKYRTVIPAFVSLTGSVVVAQTTREVPFDFAFKVPAYRIPEPKKQVKPVAPLVPPKP
ncbi:prepilin-type N-terminal cleavage/methylation domain-containing protein [Candidatus Dependentiae bacterium]|nr:prepilin-type N-terminal cleavage/methylation domain-containing protein [Candidatus Dependentiae bacterium]